MPPNRPPRSRPRGGGRQPVLTPAQRREHEAKVWAAKTQLTSFDLPTKKQLPSPLWAAPVTTVAAATRTPLGPLAVPPSPAQTQRTSDRKLVQQSRLADQIPVKPSARVKLARTLTPRERAELHRRDVAARAAAPPSILDVGHVTGGNVLGLRPPGELARGVEHVARAVAPYVTPQFGGEYGPIGPPKPFTETGKLIADVAPRAAEAGLALGARAGLGAVAQAVSAAETLRGGGTPMQLAQRGGQQQQQAAALGLSPTAYGKIGAGIGKVGLGALAAGPGFFRHPVRAAEQTMDFVRGTGDFAGALVALTNPKIPEAQRRNAIVEIAKAFWADTLTKYGPDVTWKQALRGGYDEPVIHLLDGLALAAPGAKGLSMMRYWKGGATLREAAALSRDPARLDEFAHVDVTERPRTVTVRGEHITPYDVELPASRSPLHRGIQRGYDIATRGAEMAGVGRVPGARVVTPTRRGLRQERLNARRNARRLHAEGLALWHEVSRYIGREPEQAARLFHSHQKPADLPEEVWLRGIVRDAEEMLAGRVDQPTGRRPTAAEQRLERRVARLKAEADLAANDRWKTRVADVYHEQQRLHHSLLTVAQDLKVARERLRITQGDDEAGAYTDSIYRLRQDRGEIEAQLEGATPEQTAVIRNQLQAINANIGHLEAARERALVPGLEAKGQRVQAAQDDVTTLEHRRDAVKQQLDAMTVTEEPVQSDTRTALSGIVDQLPNITTEEADAYFRLTDAAARRWGRAHGRDPGEFYSDPTGFGLREIRLLKDRADLEQLPENILAQIRFNLRRQVAPIRVVENLRRVGPHTLEDGTVLPAGDLYDPKLGLHRNKKVYRTIRGVRVPVIGRITPQEYVRRLKVLVPDQAERDMLARWYYEVAPTIERFFGEDAEAILRGFAVSQANDSPTGGLQATLRVLDLVREGKEVPSDEISAVVKSIEQAVEGQHVSKGLAAKLHDFADSIEGKDTRTWMGDDPRGGSPTANDVHAIRDLGYIDPKIAARLRNPEPGAMFRKGVDNFEIDSGGSPGEHQYERMREQYQAITDHMNEIGFDGRSDWKPAEVQALGWSAIQRMHGTSPEDLYYAVSRNSRRISLQVAKEQTGLGRELTPVEARIVANELRGPIRNIIEDTGGVYLDGDIETGVAATRDGETNAALQFNLIGSPEKVQQVVSRLGEAFGDRMMARATRETSSENAKPTLIIRHPDLADPDKAAALYQEMRAALPKKVTGFVTSQEGGLPSVEISLRGKNVTQATHVARLEEIEDVVNGAVERSLGEVEYNARATNTQTLEHERGGKDDQGRVEGAAAGRAVEDPLGAEARQRLDTAVEAVRAERPAGTQPVTALAQTRQQGLLGAVSFLNNTPEGGRILYLTEQADVSTLLHEMLGHAVNEYARSQPEEWARVEVMMGKPLADWDVPDHERFARWVERYIAEGRAPTPELVPIFQTLKTSMREIYGGIGRVSTQVPPAVRDLLDTFLGSYDDQNVFRVATMMTSAPQEMRSAKWANLFEFTNEELAALRRRNDTRAYNRSRQKLEDDIARQQTNMEKKGGWDALSEEEQLQMQATYSQFLDVAAAEEMAKADRATGLRRRISQVEDALAKPTGKEYQGALESLAHLMDQREEIIRSIFGSKYDAVFENRNDLLADWLADRKLIPPDFQRGTARYAPHVPLGGREPRRIDRPAAALEGGVIGDVDKSLLTLHSRNNLMRWQKGDVTADPKAIFDAWQNAQAFSFVKEFKDRMWEIGRELQPNEPIPDNVYIVRREGSPVPSVQRVASGQSATDEIQDALNALEARDPQALEESVTKYVNDALVKSEDLQRQLAGSVDPVSARLALQGVRVVDRNIVEGIFRPLRAGTGAGSRAVDWANTIARWSLIYTNPAYIPVNFVGNTLFLLAQQGPFAIASLVRASGIMLRDQLLADKIAGEVGELPAMAAIARGRGIGRTLRQGETKVLRKYTALPDKLPRMAAWAYEAYRMGFRTADDMKRLLDSKDPSMMRKRDIISDRATEIMVNFDRGSDWEKQVWTRVAFIWPWIRGATAWPFYYAKEFPVQTAVAANVGQVTERRRQEMMGDVRSAYRDLFPLATTKGPKGQFASTVNVASISPTSTAVGTFEPLVALLKGEKLQPGERVYDFLNPLYQTIIQTATGVNDYGQPIAPKDALFDNVVNFVPFGGLARQLVDPSKASKVYNRRDWKALLERKIGKGMIVPQTVDLNRLHAFIAQEPKTFKEKLATRIDSETKKARRIGIADPLPRSVRQAIQWQQTYEDLGTARRKQISDSPNWHPPTPGAEPKLPPYDQALDAWRVYMMAFPGSGMTPPQRSWGGKGLGEYADALMYGNTDPEWGIDPQHAVLGPLLEWRKEVQAAKREMTGG